MQRAGWGPIIAGTAFVALVGCGGGGGDGSETMPPGSDGPATTGESAGSTEAGASTMTIPLVRAGAWELAQAEDDPFADERPDWVECEIGWDVVTSGFEVDTGLCTYGAFVQPVLAEIAKGDQLELRMTRHQPSEPPSGHLGLALGQEIVFETVLPISGSDGTGESPVEVRWEATADVEVSTALHLHLHDDGPNVYRLASLTVTNR